MAFNTPRLFTPPRNPVQSLTTADLCSILRVSRETIARMERDGRLPPPIRIGRKKVWLNDAVSAILLASAQRGGQQ